MSSNWITQSFLSVAFLIPAWLAIGFFGRNYQVRPEVFLVWYFAGVVLATVFCGIPAGQTLIPSWQIVIAMACVGVFVGGVANIALFRAMAQVPNSGLPLAISNLASVGVFLASIVLGHLLPQWFERAKADPIAFLGVLLTALGVSLIAIRR